MNVWNEVWVNGECWRYREITTAFELDGKNYTSGSYLVWDPADRYAHALDAEAFRVWLQTTQKATR